MLRGFKNKKQEPKPPYTNEQWVSLLSEPVSERAVDELRQLLVRGLKPALHKYVDHELDQFVEDVAQDGVLKILDNIDTFRGESKFMVWAMKVSVREGLAELRRKRWEDISLQDVSGHRENEEDTADYSYVFAAQDSSPEQDTAQKMAVEKVEAMVEELLTKRQRKALEALLVREMPSFMVAEEMDTNRNNLYKLLYDARQKIKNEFEVQGIDPEELLREISE